jgi:hypothetical protein
MRIPEIESGTCYASHSLAHAERGKILVGRLLDASQLDQFLERTGNGAPGFRIVQWCGLAVTMSMNSAVLPMTGSAQHPFCIGSTLGSDENTWAGLPQPFHWQGSRVTKAGAT